MDPVIERTCAECGTKLTDQEIKASLDQLPVWLCDLEGYWCYWHGGKGYSGVGLHVSKAVSPERPEFSHPAFDYENRIVEVRLPQVTIAAINGPAVGIGATMTCAMDIRLASTKARIGFVFGRLGIVPEACSSWFLPRIVGLQQALEWVYSAEVLDAEAALAGRLVRSVHEPDELLPAAYDLARRFVVGRSPVALGLAKRLLHAGSAAPHPIDAHRADSLAMWHTSVGDGKEGVAAFLEKREPVFTGRASELPRILPDH